MTDGGRQPTASGSRAPREGVTAGPGQSRRGGQGEEGDSEAGSGAAWTVDESADRDGGEGDARRARGVRPGEGLGQDRPVHDRLDQRRGDDDARSDAGTWEQEGEAELPWGAGQERQQRRAGQKGQDQGQLG